MYELTNHLGNVLTTISDHKLAFSSNVNDGTVDYFLADITSAHDYYPFGMIMPNRYVNPDEYRFGFNGKEMDNEVKGIGAQYDYGFRIYDSRIGRFLSVDPLMKNYPWYSPYQFGGNSPIHNLDLDGLEELDYNKYQEGMEFGASKLDIDNFSTENISAGQNNPYFDVVYNDLHLPTFVLKNGTPSDAVKYTIDHAKVYRIDCAFFVQIVKLYGMLNSMGVDGFNKYMNEQGEQFTIRPYESTGIRNSNLYLIFEDGVNVIGPDEKIINPYYVIDKADIGTEFARKAPALINSVLQFENAVKVGEDKYAAQGFDGKTMSLKQLVKEYKKTVSKMLKRAYNERKNDGDPNIDNEYAPLNWRQVHVQIYEIRVSGANVQ